MEDQELKDTQPITDSTIPIESQELYPSQICWGQLDPHFRKADNIITLPLIQLYQDEYIAGRSPTCDIVFQADSIKSHVFLMSISRYHFKITRQTVGSHKTAKVVYFENISGNLTSVNKVVVEKGQKVILDHNDIIFIGPQKMYRFKDLLLHEKVGLPTELTTLYSSLTKLGAGACGEVNMVVSKGTFQPFAIKMIQKASSLNRMNDANKITNEVKILKALNHPFIIKLEDILDTPQKLCIVLELMEGGELFDRIRAKAPHGLPEKQAKFIIFQVAKAVDYLHSQKITHRDLKPENILLASIDEFPLVKVSDFGLSKLVDDETIMKTHCGTPMYVAPEILTKQPYTEKVDVWSLGVILYVTLSGQHAFSTNNKEMSLHDQISNGRYGFPKSKFSHVSLQAIQLIKAMMTVSISVRKNIRQVLSDDWFRDVELLNGIKKLTSPINENRPPNDLEEPPQDDSINNNMQLKKRPRIE